MTVQIAKQHVLKQRKEFYIFISAFNVSLHAQFVH